MKITKNTVPSILYTLKENDANGQIVEVVEQEHPFLFLFGAGGLLPKFEQNLDGLSKEDTFEFTITSAEGYGENNPEAVVELSKEIFVVDGAIREDLLVVGNIVPLQDQEGNPMNGVVKELKEEHVVIDFNHPMAGKTLFFSGSVIDVREASAEEIEHGHVHGPGGHNH